MCLCLSLVAPGGRHGDPLPCPPRPKPGPSVQLLAEHPCPPRLCPGAGSSLCRLLARESSEDTWAWGEDSLGMLREGLQGGQAKEMLTNLVPISAK